MEENGGARPITTLKVRVVVERTTRDGICPVTLGAKNGVEEKVNKPGNALDEQLAECTLSPLNCLPILLVAPASSNSGRIACRSSVAETTGKSRINTQPSNAKERNPQANSGE